MWSPGSRILATAGGDNTVLIWTSPAWTTSGTDSSPARAPPPEAAFRNRSGNSTSPPCPSSPRAHDRAEKALDRSAEVESAVSPPSGPPPTAPEPC
ncbi:hypothetical protein AB0K14_26395 [Actinosynnema sp. NPDC050801]|uniref:hypothetical protein n=1 Tax=unclassified Actinosynnema TaxID=2637065 RepID=UPI0033EFB95D